MKPPDLEEYLKIGKIIRNLLEESKRQQGGHKRIGLEDVNQSVQIDP